VYNHSSAVSADRHTRKTLGEGELKREGKGKKGGKKTKVPDASGNPLGEDITKRQGTELVPKNRVTEGKKETLCAIARNSPGSFRTQKKERMGKDPTLEEDEQKQANERKQE